ncbi:kinase-like domain-containing protein [Sporodiniella umbellata]|nr:kinase-like domain-containing protein [Sporodiniella umbellata]
MGALCCCQSNINFEEEEAQLRHFYLLRVIGKGAFGKVRIVQHKKNQTEYALKYIRKSKCIELNAVRNILTERNMLELIDHPFIVNLRYAFHDNENIFMVLDLMLGGDLRFHLNSLGSFNELQVRFYVAELILSLDHIHQQQIIHRDIKPDNILLDDKGHAHLSDFNVAAALTPQKPYRQNRAGSLIYMAPEILLHQKYAEEVDWWSLGVTAYELLFGKRPFEGVTNDDVKLAIVKESLEFPKNVYISEECQQVLKGLLAKGPKERLGHGEHGVKNLKAHPWFQGIDWQQLELKQAQPPFIPSKDSPNYDAIHELEELLFEEEPLRAHSKSKTTKLEEMIEINTKFVPYDHTNVKKNPPIDIVGSSEPTNIIRRVGGAIHEKIEQAKYSSQGYYELSEQ